MSLIKTAAILLLSAVGLPVNRAQSRLITGEPGRCSTKRCCGYREDLDNTDINCTLLSIEECLLNDEICEWNCAPKMRFQSNRRGKSKRTFVKFDAGNGRPREPIIDETATDSMPRKPKTIEEMQQHSSFLVYNKGCGDVYRVDIDNTTAYNRLLEQDIYMHKFAPSHTKGNDRDGESLSDIRRRLQIMGSDGRSSTGASSFPYSTAALIEYDQGEFSYSCSGVMISEKAVLTAAHCLYDTENNEWGSGYNVLIGSDENTDTWWSWDYIDWSYAVIPTAYADKSSYYSTYDIGVIFLDEKPDEGYMGFGYDTSFEAPENFNTFGYPGDKTYGTLWRQYCAWDTVNDEDFHSTECDVYPGQSGSPQYQYWSSTDTRIIYGVASGYSNYYTLSSRITSGLYNMICDYIEDNGETDRCG